MTNSKTYNVAGASVEITTNLYPCKIDVHITVDLGNLDAAEPDHSPHNLVNYLQLSNYNTRDTYWWSRVHRTISVRTGSQARRVINNALAKIEDAIESAKIQRQARKMEMDVIY